MDDEIRGQLSGAGLELLGSQYVAGTLTPEQAWRMVISGNAGLWVTVSDDADRRLDTVNENWHKLSEDLGLIGSDGEFLLSLPGPGAWEKPWYRVRKASELRMAQVLAPYPGEPEYVTASLRGFPVVGVTSEENATWILVFEG
ncbi:hypothetical protein G4H71_20380 [Rhodococcus triatomae]|uniref:Uncharacterized protein n=1 Tax=Rhodococcus triatomae TaxID=300028 RepID=A0A1G8S7F3_9NOCA|nr:hypothetical protein [Rhodococcus triatomae]QNG19002.1 hypothetical protein G4H72_10000 [Rhodococcus triatomae]QNG25085.1 hypothetical protein G4H71_20380 [Rhodococcus triatomae]SDJ24610.1 hypothetical protein SAMN05444695_1204 [Rhodococcus triatomae]